jgi:YVTN family beta-propeller protein
MNKTLVTLCSLVFGVVLSSCGGADDAHDRTLDAAKAELVSIDVGTAPSALAYGGSSLWVANFDADTVSRVDPRTGRVVGAPIKVGNGPVGVAVTPKWVWVAHQFDSTVTRIAQRSGRVIGTPIRVPDRPLAIAAGAGAVWVFSSTPGTLTKIDPNTGTVRSTSPRIVARGTSNQDYAGLAIAGSLVLVPSPAENALVRIDASTNRPAGPAIDVGTGPSRVGVAFGSAWVANLDGASVTRVDLRTGKSLAEIPVGGLPVAVVGGGGVVWVADQRGGALVRIDPATNAVTGEPIPVGPTGVRPHAVAYADGRPWVADQAGGTLVTLDTTTG